LWNAFRFYFCERTPFYDQHVLRAVEGGCRQVVLVAAGLDSRAFRLGLPEDATVFELDQAAVLDFKQAVLDQHGVVPTCDRVPVPVDLRVGWPPSLLAAGFDGTLPTLWITEGLLMYLSSSDAGQLLARITALSAPGRLAGRPGVDARPGNHHHRTGESPRAARSARVRAGRRPARVAVRRHIRPGGSPA
jgi:methyltransferase (TIGR00027 family)